MSEKSKRTSKIKPTMIRDVYANNFKEEILNICHLIEEFPYVGMDTEFPGIIYSKENQQLRGLSNYQLTKLNVDVMKVIQVGITLCDKNGFYPEDICTWQFNLKFDINNDTHQPSSIQMLMTSGIDFDAHHKNGIPHMVFGEYLIISGLLLNPDVNWVTFHGIYDFAYLLKVITNSKLPDLENEFYDALSLYFVNYYDLRHLIQFSDYSRGSLQRLAIECNIQRVGNQHQAGSDSLVTVMAFFKLVQEVFSGSSVSIYKNVLFHYVEKDDVEFEASKIPYYGQGGYNYQNFRNNMHMYMYPYYNTMGGIGNMNNMNMMNYQNSNVSLEEKKKGTEDQ